MRVPLPLIDDVVWWNEDEDIIVGKVLLVDTKKRLVKVVRMDNSLHHVLDWGCEEYDPSRTPKRLIMGWVKPHIQEERFRIAVLGKKGYGVRTEWRHHLQSKGEE